MISSRPHALKDFVLRALGNSFDERKIEKDKNTASLEFFNSAISVLQFLAIALGGGLRVWGVWKASSFTLFATIGAKVVDIVVNIVKAQPMVKMNGSANPPLTAPPVLAGGKSRDGNSTGAIWGCMGDTVLLCRYTLLWPDSLAKPPFEPHLKYFKKGF